MSNKSIKISKIDYSDNKNNSIKPEDKNMELNISTVINTKNNELNKIN
jgi:hypothetical protein